MWKFEMRARNLVDCNDQDGIGEVSNMLHDHYQRAVLYIQKKILQLESSVDRRAITCVMNIW